MPHSYSLVPNRSKELSKLLNPRQIERFGWSNAQQVRLASLMPHLSKKLNKLQYPRQIRLLLNWLSRSLQGVLANMESCDIKASTFELQFPYCVHLFGDKVIQICLKIDATHYYRNDLLLRQKTQKKVAGPRSWYNNNKKHWFDVSLSKDAFFTGRVTNDRHCACLINKSLPY